MEYAWKPIGVLLGIEKTQVHPKAGTKKVMFSASAQARACELTSATGVNQQTHESSMSAVSRAFTPPGGRPLWLGW